MLDLVFQCYIDHLIHHMNLVLLNNKEERIMVVLYGLYYIMGNFGIITTNPMLAVWSHLLILERVSNIPRWVD